MKIMPYGMSFEQALRSGMLGRIECRAYLDWIKTLPCDACGAPAPSDPSHYNHSRGIGTKSPDLWAIPHCRTCHNKEHHDSNAFQAVNGNHKERAALYLLRAIVEGRLVWVGEKRG